MFAEVYKKDSLQDEEYAECYVFDKRMLLPKGDSETYSSDYDEAIIKNFHQKQSSYAQSEGYHSYVSSNDSAIIAPFSDRSQVDSDFIGTADENIFAAQRHSNAITDGGGWSSDSTKCRNSYSHPGNTKNVNFDRYNSQHIVHSARVQTPQKLHSETVLYLDAATASQQFHHKDTNQNHSYVNSQLRKLYPVNTYSVQPQPVTATNNATSVSEFNGGMQSSPQPPPPPPPPPKAQQSKHAFEIDSQKFDHVEHCAEYTFLDPGKKRIVSNQNLKVIQKQALISYYERHHSAWRSEPQLSLNSSSSRPRLPTPTSCRLTSPSDNEESTSTYNTNLTIHSIENFTSNNSVIGNDCLTDYSCHNFRLESAVNESSISPEDKVPDLPPKKAHLRSTTVTVAQRMSSPDLPPPSPPPVSEEEIYVPDEPFPPPPSEVAFICDSTKTAASAVPKITLAGCDFVTNATTESFVSCRPPSVMRTNIPSAFATNELSTQPSVVRCDSVSYCRNFSNTKNSSPVADLLGKTREKGLLKCNTSRLSSSSFRSYTRTSNEFDAKTERYTKRQSSTSASASSDMLSEKLQISPKLPQIHDTLTASHSARIYDGHPIEQKVKTIRTLFEDKFRKSINSKNFQFPSFSFIHSDKFPSKLDPRFPRTSYQISQCSNQRETRDIEKGVISNATGIYKRTASPSRRGYDNESANSTRRVIDDAKFNERYENTITTSSVCQTATVLGAREYETTTDYNSTVNVAACPLMVGNVSLLDNRISKLPASEKFINKCENSPLHQQHSSLFCLNRSRSTSKSSFSLHSTNIPASPQPVLPNSELSESDFSNFSNDHQSIHSATSSTQPPSSERLNKNHSAVVGSTQTNDRSSFVDDDLEFCQQKANSTCREKSNNSITSRADSSNCTIDAASQTDVDAVSKEHLSEKSLIDIASSPRIEDEAEKLRHEVISCLGPSNRLYKILAYQSDAKKSSDYLENMFEETPVLQMPICLKKDLCSVNESEDTRLQEGSISYHKVELEVLQQSKQSEVCDKIQNVSPSVTTTTTPTTMLIQKKKNLIKHLLHKLDTLKAEQNAVSRECLRNDELWVTISEKISKSVSPRDASKYKLHVQEVGQITSLLLGLGARLAKIENSLLHLPENNCQNERKVLEDKKNQLVQQLEDAKELKKNIDKRSSSLILLLQKFFNEQELNDYQYFIQTKCKLLIYNRNINDKIFYVEQQVNALKDDKD